MAQPDFGKTSRDYARFRVGFPKSFYQRLVVYRIGLPGQRILDLGTGTGTLAHGFARLGCHVIGVDIAHPQLLQATELIAGRETRIDFLLSKAEYLPLPNHSVDVVIAGQSWHWFARLQVAEEASRILDQDGLLVIAHFDWIPLSGNIAQATEELILAYNPQWQMANGNGLYPQWLRDLGETGFREIETFSYDELVPYSQEAWRGRIRASAGVAATLPPEAVLQFDKALKQLLESISSTPMLQIQHRIFVVIAKPPG